MFHMSGLEWLNSAASLFNNLFPLFALLMGLSLGIGLLRLVFNSMRRIFDALPSSTHTEDDEVYDEKPKNDPDHPKAKAIGMNADGEIIFDDQPETPFFYQHDDSKLG